MLGRLFRQSTVAPAMPSMTRFRNLVLPERFVNKISDRDMFNPAMVRKVLQIGLPGRTVRSQKGLFHNLVVRRGHTISHSDVRNIRQHKINAVQKVFYSNLLKRHFDIPVTTKAIRCIRKYGGFDNYILLTKPKNMYSMFGEYLRRVMLDKLNNPGRDWDHISIFGSYIKRRKQRPLLKKKEGIWHSPLYRHADLSRFQLGNKHTWVPVKRKPIDISQYQRAEDPNMGVYVEEDTEYQPPSDIAKHMTQRAAMRGDKQAIMGMRKSTSLMAEMGMKFDDLSGRTIGVENPFAETKKKPIVP